MKRIEKKESRKRRGAFMLAMAMVLSIVLPLCQSVSNAVSEGDLYFPTGGVTDGRRDVLCSADDR